MKATLFNQSLNRETLSMDSKLWYSRKMILPNQTNRNGECWVYVEVSVKKKTYRGEHHEGYKRIMKRFNTGVQINPKSWSDSKQEIKPGAKNSFELNAMINSFFGGLNGYIVQLTRRDNYVELPAELKELETLFGNNVVKVRSKGLLDYMQEYIDMRKKRGDMHGTVKEFISVRNRLLAFQESTKRNLEWSDVTLILSDDLKNFWLPIYNPNTIKKSFTVFKTFLNFYYQRKDSYRINLNGTFLQKAFGEIRTFKSDPIALTEDEIRRIAEFTKKDFQNYTYKEGKKVVRLTSAQIGRMILTQQRVILQASTGLRISDLFRIKPSNIVENCIRLRPTKTIHTKSNNTVNIPLNHLSEGVLKPLGMDSTKLKISSQKHNQNIKVLLGIIGINEKISVYEFDNESSSHVEKVVKKCDVLTSHNMRDTYISIAVKRGVPIPIILKHTGQSSYDVIKRYIDIHQKDLTQTTNAVF